MKMAYQLHKSTGLCKSMGLLWMDLHGRMDPWPRNFHILWVQLKKKKKKKRKKENLCLSPSLSYALLCVS